MRKVLPSTRKIRARKIIIKSNNDTVEICLNEYIVDKIPRKGYWKNPEHQRSYLDRFAQHVGIKLQEEWYNIEHRMFGSTALMKMNNGSFFETLKNIYSEFEWHPWKFHVVASFWTSKEHVRSYFDWLAAENGIHTYEDWYKTLNIDFIRANHGKGILTHYGDSWITAIMSTYPEFIWHPWRFDVAPRNYWESPQNYKKFCDWFAEENQLENLDAWYSVKPVHFAEQGGVTLMQKFSGHLIKVLAAVYPEHPWQYWRYTKLPAHFWKDESNIKGYLQWAEQQLGIQSVDDWHNVLYDQMVALKACTLLNYKKGLLEILATYYPHHRWRSKVFGKGPEAWHKSEGTLVSVLGDIMTENVHIKKRVKEAQQQQQLLIEGSTVTSSET